MKAVDDEADLRRTSLRLGLQAGLLVIGCLLVVGVLVFVVYERTADAAANQLLSDTTANIDSASEAPPGIRVVVVTPRGRSVSPEMPEGLPDEAQLAATARDRQTRQAEIVRDGDHYTVRTQAISDRVIQAVLDSHEADEQRGRILTSLLVAGVVGVALAVLLAAWLARRTVRPMAQTIAMQRRFVADASHELRTPLTLLSTRAQLLARHLRRDAEVTDQVTADLDGVIADTKTLTAILDELLAAADSRGEEGWSTVDVAELAAEVAEAAAAEAQRLDVAVAVEGVPSALVDGSPGALRRALLALVDNAVSHATSRVAVTVRSSGRRVQLLVIDDGPGIPKDIAPRLFDRFSSMRAPARSATAADGPRHYGLGLALVADVAANHHGRVEATNRMDGHLGAVFTFTLPVHR